MQSGSLNAKAATAEHEPHTSLTENESEASSLKQVHPRIQVGDRIRKPVSQVYCIRVNCDHLVTGILATEQKHADETAPKKRKCTREMHERQPLRKRRPT